MVLLLGHTSTSSWFELYFVVISRKFLWSNHFICFSFNHTISYHYTICFICFSTYIKHFYIVYSSEVSGFIFFFLSLYSLYTLFTETNSSWLIYESIKTLEIRTLIVFNSSFPNNFILSCFFFFFLSLSYTF